MDLRHFGRHYIGVTLGRCDCMYPLDYGYRLHHMRKGPTDMPTSMSINHKLTIEDNVRQTLLLARRSRGRVESRLLRAYASGRTSVLI